ncbi:MAG: type II toxin-antitoxin system VapB family antitoxin [Micrococcales bacterium]|nr:type II toxin-antitoxin system VapB family antitoxin [Micrococcales bacterium]
MTRTNIDIDDDLIAEVIRQNGLKSKREAVDFALRRVVRRRLSTDELLALEGTVHWDGDLDAMRDDAGLVL